MLPRREPDVLAIADMDSLSSAAWNALTQPEPTLNRVRSAASLHALHSHVHLLKPEDRGISAALDLVGRLWNEYVPGKPRPLDAVFGPYDIAPRRANIEEKLHNANRQLVWGDGLLPPWQKPPAAPRRSNAASSSTATACLLAKTARGHALSASTANAWRSPATTISQHKPIPQTLAKPVVMRSPRGPRTLPVPSADRKPGRCEAFGGASKPPGPWRPCRHVGPVQHPPKPGTEPSSCARGRARPGQPRRTGGGSGDDAGDAGLQLERQRLPTCPFYGTTPLSYRF